MQEPFEKFSGFSIQKSGKVNQKIDLSAFLFICFGRRSWFHQVDGQLRLFDDPQIVVIGAELARLLEVDPDVAVDLLLLNFDIIGKSAREEEYHTLADFAERAVLADLAEAGGDGDVESRFFLDFADSGLLFGLAVLDVTFGEAPVPAVVVLDEQDLGVLTCLVEDDAAAGFFVRVL